MAIARMPLANAKNDADGVAHIHLQGVKDSSTPRRRRMLAPGTVVVIGIAGGLLVHFVSPGQGSYYPRCPFLALTGYYCPGCGSTRMLAALSHGDLHTAMNRNPLGVVAVALLAVIFTRWTGRLWTGAPRTISRPWVPIAVLIVVLVYWVTRNIPGWTFLSPQ